MPAGGLIRLQKLKRTLQCTAIRAKVEIVIANAFPHMFIMSATYMMIPNR